MTSLRWLRRDVRLDDNPALVTAAQEGAVCVLFVIDPGLSDRCSPRRRDLLVAGLADLDSQLSEQGGRLRVEHGDPSLVVPRVAGALSADVVHVNSEVTSYGLRRDHRVGARCELIGHEGVRPSAGLDTHQPGRPLQGVRGMARVRAIAAY